MLNWSLEQFKINFAKLSEYLGESMGNIYSDYSFYKNLQFVSESGKTTLPFPEQFQLENSFS